MEQIELVRKLIKPGTEILSQLTPEKCELLHDAFGIAGEAGEILDIIKKHVVYNVPLSQEHEGVSLRDHLKEELGDLLFFVRDAIDKLGFTEKEIEAANISKLLKRYPNAGYSDALASQRLDKRFVLDRVGLKIHIGDRVEHIVTSRRFAVAGILTEHEKGGPVIQDSNGCTYPPSELFFCESHSE